MKNPRLSEATVTAGQFQYRERDCAECGGAGELEDSPALRCLECNGYGVLWYDREVAAPGLSDYITGDALLAKLEPRRS